MSKNPIPTDWDGESWCYWSVCWPESPLWRGLLLGLITSATRGRFWDEKTGIVTEAQAIGRQIANLNSYLEECCMSCDEGSKLVSAINTAIAVIGGSGGGACGCGSGGAGSTQPPPSPIDPGPPGEQIGDPPPGFETWEEYETYKCQIATAIVDGVEKDMAWAETADWVTMTATALAIAFITPVPFDDLAAFIGLTLALVIEEVYMSAIDDIQSALASDFDDFVCALYSSNNAQAAKANWDEQAGTSIDGQTGAFYAGIEKSMLRKMVSYEVTNKLFERDIALENNTEPGDCSGCESCDQAWSYGSGDIDNGGTFLSEPVAAEHRIEFIIGWQQHARITAIVGWTDASGPPNENWRACSTLTPACAAPYGNDVLNQVNPPSLPFDMPCVEAVSIRSGTAFTIDWEVVGPGEECP